MQRIHFGKLRERCLKKKLTMTEKKKIESFLAFPPEVGLIRPETSPPQRKQDVFFTV